MPALRASSGTGRFLRSVPLLSRREPTLPSWDYGDARIRNDVGEVSLIYQLPAELHCTVNIVHSARLSRSSRSAICPILGCFSRSVSDRAAQTSAARLAVSCIDAGGRSRSRIITSDTGDLAITYNSFGSTSGPRICHPCSGHTAALNTRRILSICQSSRLKHASRKFIVACMSKAPAWYGDEAGDGSRSIRYGFG